MNSTVARLCALAVTATLLIAAIGASSEDLQPSARLVLVAAVLGVVAPLFWAGGTGSAAATVGRIAGWSLAVAVLAVLLATAFDAGPPARVAAGCGMLFLVMLVTHALAANLELLVRPWATDDSGSREVATWLSTAALAVLASAPLWLGPAAELVSDSQARALDAVVGMSPLTHLAVASGNDLLRNQWFYQHSNLAGLQFSYPRPAALVPAYLALLAVLLVPQVLRMWRGPAMRVAALHSTTESHR
jgi:hypothetical protein